MKIRLSLIKNTTERQENTTKTSWAKLKISLVEVDNEVEVDIIVEVTTCPEGVGCRVGGGQNENNAKSALTKVEVKV